MDKQTKEIHDVTKVIKDVRTGAVVIIAIVFIAIMLFGVGALAFQYFTWELR